VLLVFNLTRSFLQVVRDYTVDECLSGIVTGVRCTSKKRVEEKEAHAEIVVVVCVALFLWGGDGGVLNLLGAESA